MALTLAFEEKESGVIERPPHPADDPILTYALILRTLLVGVILLIAAYGLFLYEKSIGASMAQPKTVITTVFVVLEGFYLLNCRPLVRPKTAVGLFSGKFIYMGIDLMIVLQLLLVYLPVWNTFFIPNLLVSCPGTG